jgi:AcrR family transcriptional regulator
LNERSANGITVSSSTRRALQKQERRNQLLDTARRLFAEKGVEGTTIKDIADEAGVAQGLLYHYFKGKEELFWAIIARDNPLPLMTEVFLGAEDRPAREVLTRAGLRAHQFLTERADLLRIVVRELITRSEMQQAVKVMQAVAFGFLTRYLEARIAAGELRPHNPDVTARMLVGSVVAIHVTEAPAEAFIPEVVDTVLRAIAAVGQPD